MEVGNLRNLGIIDVSMNKLLGEIPSTLKCWKSFILVEIFFKEVFLPSLGSLRDIRVIDVSKKQLVRENTRFLARLHGLYYLNLSFNHFEGEVPRLGIFENASVVSVVRNNKLCGGNPDMHLPACPSQSPRKKHDFHTFRVIIGIASSFKFLILLLLFCFLNGRGWMRSSRRKPQGSTPIKEQHESLFYAELVKATTGFSRDNIIGTGSFGIIYKEVHNEDTRRLLLLRYWTLKPKEHPKALWQNVKPWDTSDTGISSRSLQHVQA